MNTDRQSMKRRADDADRMNLPAVKFSDGRFVLEYSDIATVA